MLQGAGWVSGRTSNLPGKLHRSQPTGPRAGLQCKSYFPPVFFPSAASHLKIESARGGPPQGSS